MGSLVLPANWSSGLSNVKHCHESFGLKHSVFSTPVRYSPMLSCHLCRKLLGPMKPGNNSFTVHETDLLRNQQLDSICSDYLSKEPNRNHGVYGVQRPLFMVVSPSKHLDCGSESGRPQGWGKGHPSNKPWIHCVFVRGYPFHLVVAKTTQGKPTLLGVQKHTHAKTTQTWASKQAVVGVPFAHISVMQLQRLGQGKPPSNSTT